MLPLTVRDYRIAQASVEPLICVAQSPQVAASGIGSEVLSVPVLQVLCAVHAVQVSHTLRL